MWQTSYGSHIQWAINITNEQEKDKPIQKWLQDIDNIMEEEITSKHEKMLNDVNDSRNAN